MLLDILKKAVELINEIDDGRIISEFKDQIRAENEKAEREIAEAKKRAEAERKRQNDAWRKQAEAKKRQAEAKKKQAEEKKKQAAEEERRTAEKNRFREAIEESEKRRREQENREVKIYDVDDEGIRRGLQKFKLDMMKVDPFYGDILMKMKIIEDYNIPTACTNGRCIRYNPDFFRTLDEGQRNFVLLHEVYHILYLHWKRRGDRNPRMWNIACDWMVNWELMCLKIRLPKFIKFEMPDEGCFLKNVFYTETAEGFYNGLMEDTKELPNGDLYCFRAGGGLVDLKVEDLVAAPDTLDEIETAGCEREIRELIKDTIKKRGSGSYIRIPTGILENVKSEPLPWQRLLRDFLQQREDEESSYYTPERKYIHMDLIVPGIGKRDDELGEVWAFVDSSGSIDADVMSKFMLQLAGITGEFSCSMNIAFWDTEVSEVFKNIRNKKQVLECKTGHSGGTDINCVYRYINENRVRPDVLLILTDGYFGTLSEPVGRLKKKTILVLTENSADILKDNDIGRLAKL